MRTFKIFYDTPNPEWVEVPEDVGDDELDSYILDNAPKAEGFPCGYEEWV